MKDKHIEVWFLKDDTYQVVDYYNPDEQEYKVLFQGSIADCEAWIRLRKGGYL